MSVDVDAFLQALKKRLSTRTDEELASYLGVSKKTVSSWRSRGRVPYSVQVAYPLQPAELYAVVEKEGLSNAEQMEIVTRAVALHLRDRYRDLIDTDSREDGYLFWSAELPRIMARVERHARARAHPTMHLVSVIGELIDSIERGEILIFAEALDYERTKKR